MPEEVGFRQCVTNDIESVLELWRLAGSTPSITDRVEVLQMVLDFGASSVILASVDSVVAGSIICAFDGWRGNIYRLAVHPEHQRKGIARSLVSEAEAWRKSVV